MHGYFLDSATELKQNLTLSKYGTEIPFDPCGGQIIVTNTFRLDSMVTAMQDEIHHT